jgi:branched-chain amino acid transport system permease protein
MPLEIDNWLSQLQRRLTGPAQRSTQSAWRRFLAVAVFLLAVALVVPSQIHSTLNQNLVNLWLLYSIAALGFYWIFGLAGRFAFCQTIMMGGGAYFSAYLSREGASFWVSLIVSIAAVSLVAAIIALALRRAQEFYFAIATLAVTEIGLVVFQEATSFTGPDGSVLNVSPITVFGHPLTSELDMFWALLAGLGLLLILNALIELSPVRRDVIAARENGAVARSSGVRVEWLQGSMFVIGSAAGALSGVLFAHVNGYVGTDSFSLDLAVGIFLMLILGGSRSVWGPIIGAGIYVELPQLLTSIDQYSQIVYGVILLVVIIVMPFGIMGAVNQGVAYLRGRSEKRAAASAAVETNHAGTVTDVDALPPFDLPSGGGADQVVVAAGPVGAKGGELLRAENVRVHFDAVVAVDGVSIRVARGEAVGVVGPNGSGKTTLLNALTGVVPAQGDVTINGAAVPLGRSGALRRAGVFRCYQSPQVIDPLSGTENVMMGSPDWARRGLLGAWVLRRSMRRHERERQIVAERALRRVEHSEVANLEGASLPYGQRRMLEVARGIGSGAQLIMFDEPSAGLNHVETEHLSTILRDLKAQNIGLIVVDHKIDFIDAVCDRVIVLQLGKIVAEGTPAEVWSNALVADAYLGAQA